MDAVSFSSGTLALLVGDSARAKTLYDTLNEQSASGHVADTYGGLSRSASATALSLRPALATQTALQGDIDAATGRLDVARSALQGISDIASKYFADSGSLSGLNPGQVSAIAANARAALGQVGQLLNSRYGDIYVFAGDDTGNPPVPDGGNLGSGSLATQIAATVQNLSSTGAASVIADTRNAASPGGTALFSTVIESGAAQRPTAATADGQRTPVGIVAGQNGDVVSSGGSTTGSYVRDIVRALATIGALSDSQVGTPGYTDVVRDAHDTLGAAITALGQDAGVLGTRESDLATQRSRLGDVSDALRTQVTNVEDVDAAATLTALSSAKTQLEASYQLISSLQGLSLTKYLPGG